MNRQIQVAQSLPHAMCVLILRPEESELPTFCSHPEFQRVCDDYVSQDYKNDIWLQRSPKTPTIPVVLHSLYTPKSLFQKSLFYDLVMRKIGCEYGTSLVAWEDQTWLATLTVFRTEDQGDFRENDLSILSALHLHFQSAVKRIATFKEERLGNNSLEALIWNLPTAALVLNWNLKILYSNAAGQNMVAAWKQSDINNPIKPSRCFSVPCEILTKITEKKRCLNDLRPNRTGGPSMIPLFDFPHQKLTLFTAKVFFIPSKTLTLSRGTFVIIFHRREETPNYRNGYDSITLLSKRERSVVLLATLGKTSTQIASNLGTRSITVRAQLHSAYKKLGIHSRFELIHMFPKGFSLEQHNSSPS
jgi:DNA-binding CsgD family transcriptional regulator